MQKTLADIEAELDARLEYFKKEGRILEAQRLEQRTRYDLEMRRGWLLRRHRKLLPPSTSAPRAPALGPAGLHASRYLLVLDESHMMVPQLRGMYNGDRSRKEILVDYGFRLPSALDNRPLKFPNSRK